MKVRRKEDFWIEEESLTQGKQEEMKKEGRQRWRGRMEGRRNE